MKKRNRMCMQWAAVIMLLMLTGCSSEYVMVVVRPPRNPTTLGHVEGKASGVRVGLIPIRLNTRTLRAYKAALEQAPEATSLINVTLQEEWYWCYLWTSHTVTITGEAVK